MVYPVRIATALARINTLSEANAMFSRSRFLPMPRQQVLVPLLRTLLFLPQHF